MPLRVTLVQAGLHWQDPEGNRRAFGATLGTLAAGATDLVVLPEMFTTGFDVAAGAPAEAANGPTLAWMRDWSRRLDAAVVGSVMTRDGAHRVNRLWFVTPDGGAQPYDKRHLFRMAGEHEHFTAGGAPLLAEFRGWKIAPLICYDLRFPVWSRRRPGYDYDLLLYVANWPARRAYAWRQLLIARAIENQAYVVGVNRIGPDGNGIEHQGDSAAHDFLGQPLATLGDSSGVVAVSLSEGALAEFRARFPAHLDADRFELSDLGAPR